MATHTLDLAAFRAAFPAYSNATTFPDAQLLAYFQNATMYVSANDSLCGGLNGAMLDWVLQLMTAHITASFVLISQGKTNIVITGSTVSKVSISLEPPPTRDAWGWWLATTPYGLQISALLDVQAAGGWSVGGLPERGGFRKAGGTFRG